MRTITLKGVNETVKQIQTGKAVGMNELSVEMMKASELKGIKWLTRLFNVCGEEE